MTETLLALGFTPSLINIIYTTDYLYKQVNDVLQVRDNYTEDQLIETIRDIIIFAQPSF